MKQRAPSLHGELLHCCLHFLLITGIQNNEPKACSSRCHLYGTKASHLIWRECIPSSGRNKYYLEREEQQETAWDVGGLQRGIDGRVDCAEGDCGTLYGGNATDYRLAAHVTLSHEKLDSSVSQGVCLELTCVHIWYILYIYTHIKTFRNCESNMLGENF